MAVKSTRSGKVILIPVDFSTVADSALLHGFELARQLHCRVCLLHVINLPPGATHNSEDTESLQKYGELMNYKTRYEIEYKVSTDVLLRGGNLFRILNTVVAEIRPVLMLMGTHGKQGLQHLYGSHALRVVLDAPCPVMVVHECTSPRGYNRILLPVNHEVDPYRLVEWVSRFYRMFNAEIHLFRGVETDTVRDNLIREAALHIASALKKKRIMCKITNAGSPDDFQGQVLSHAIAMDSDLLMTMAMPAHDAAGFNFSAFNERLMFNPGRIPVMFIDRAGTEG